MLLSLCPPFAVPIITWVLTIPVTMKDELNITYTFKPVIIFEDKKGGAREQAELQLKEEATPGEVLLLVEL